VSTRRVSYTLVLSIILSIFTSIGAPVIASPPSAAVGPLEVLPGWFLSAPPLAQDAADAAQAAAEVAIQISAADLTACADEAVVTITVSNPSAVEAVQNAVATVTISAGSLLDCPPAGPCTPVAQWTETVGDIGTGGSVDFDVYVDLDCVESGTLNISGSYEDDQGTDFTFDVTEDLPITAPALSVTISTPPIDITCGDIYTWTVTVQNTGDATAEVVRTGVEIGADFNLLDATAPSCFDPGHYDFVYFETTNLAPGASMVYEIRTQFLNPGGIANGCQLVKRSIHVMSAWGCGVPDGDPSTGQVFFGSGAPCNGADPGVECLSAPVVADGAYVPIPDVVISSTSAAFSNCDPTGMGTISVTILNQERWQDTGPLPAGTDVVITVTVDPGTPEEATFILTHTLAAELAIGESLEISAQFPANELSCGPHTYLAELAPLCECDWNNNTLAGEFEVYCGGISTIVASSDCLVSMQGTGFITGTAPFSWVWNYGDGLISAGSGSVPTGQIQTTHQYTQCGDYPVSLVVTDSVGCVLIDQTPVNVNEPPVADIGVIDVTCDGGVVIENASQDCDEDNDPSPILGRMETLTFTWWLENEAGVVIWTDTFVNSEETPYPGVIVPAATIVDCGYYTVTVVVTDSAGCSDSAEMPFYANTPPEAAQVTFEDIDVCYSSDQVFSGYAEDCDGDILTYTWTFSGDGVITPTVSVTAPSGTLVTGTMPVAGCGLVRIDFAAYDGEMCVATDTLTYDVPCCSTEDSIAMTAELLTAIEDTVEAGDVISFAVNITYTGESPATELQLMNQFDPALLTYVGSDPATGIVSSPGTVTWDDLTTAFGDLVAGDAISMTVTMQAIAATERTTCTLGLSGFNACECALPATLTIRPVAPRTPTAVELLYFRVAGVFNKAVTLEWATAAEIDNFGFHVYRAPAPDIARATLLSLVPALGPKSVYQYVDTIPFEGPWYYWIVDLDTNGRETPHGPVSTQGTSAVLEELYYLPLVLRGATGETGATPQAAAP